MELFILLIFSAFLILCLLMGQPLVLALIGGFILFFLYGLKQGKSWQDMTALALSGIRTTQNVLITLALVGILTASWRASGTIPYIVYHAAQWCRPDDIVVASFLLCSLISVLTGTAFGTAATMGVICMTIANSMNVPPIYSGGAILAGSYFGDRCSPMSTSALLVAAITKTDIFTNCRLMVKTAALPLLASCILYGAAGFFFPSSSGGDRTVTIFAQFFYLSWETLIPALAVVILSACRVKVKYIMLCSIAAATAVAVYIQQTPAATLLSTYVLGFQPEDPALWQLLHGGGLLSMANVLAIICISASYAGMFAGTGFLHTIQAGMTRLSRRISPFGAILVTSVAAAMISCNQTLAIMLTHQLCRTVEPDRQRMALALENTAVVVTPLVPWAIACSVTLSVVDGPISSILTAWYLYFIPLWNYALSLRKTSRHNAETT